MRAERKSGMTWADHGEMSFQEQRCSMGLCTDIEREPWGPPLAAPLMVEVVSPKEHGAPEP